MGWKVVIDKQVCKWSGLCAAMAPDHIRETTAGKPQPVIQGPQEGQVPPEILDATDCCPTGAFSVEDTYDDGGQHGE